MKKFIAFSLFFFALGNAELQIRDYYGEVKPIRVCLDSFNDPAFYYLDVDGDGKKDTLKIYFEQVGYWLACLDHDEKVDIVGCDIEADENILEFASAYIISPQKPVLIVKLSRGTSEDYGIYVVDLVRTVRGLRADFLLNENAGWANSPTTIVRPNLIEYRHFRGWVTERFIWDGEKFVHQVPED